MCNLLKKTGAIGASIITAIFTFVPESAFQLIQVQEWDSWKVILLNRIAAATVVFIVVFIGLLLYQKVRTKISINGKTYCIQVQYKDIFEMHGCKKIIPFDECFSTSVGDAPSQIKLSSICGQYLMRYPISDINTIISTAAVNPLKEKSQYQRQQKYRMGTLIPRDDYLLMSFAKLDKDGIGEITRDEYLECLAHLWKEINKHYAQKDICVPILGSGITRFDGEQPTQQELLDIMISSYKLSTKKIKKPCKLFIVCRRTEGFSLNKIGISV